MENKNLPETTVDSVGFNETVLDNLVLDIYNKMERIRKNLDQLSIIVEKSNSYFNSINADLYNKKYDNFKENYKNFISNINSYADDFRNLKTKNSNTVAQMLSYIKVEQYGLDEYDDRGNK